MGNTKCPFSGSLVHSRRENQNVGEIMKFGSFFKKYRRILFVGLLASCYVITSAAFVEIGSKHPRLSPSIRPLVKSKSASAANSQPNKFAAQIQENSKQAEGQTEVVATSWVAEPA